MASPVEQFRLTPLVPIEIGSVDISLTNSSAFMIAAVAVVTLFLTLSMRAGKLVPGRWQSMAELSYEFIANMVRDNVGRDGRQYFPFIFTLFMFILAGNLLGMLPYAYTFTSQIVVTFGLAFVVFIGVTIIGLVRHGTHFFTYFFPDGAPLWMAPLLVPIEVISYLSRPVSLSVRLFANMMAGHTMLKVFAGFVVSLGAFGFVPLIATIAFTGLEFVVSFLQAFIFSVLTCIYLNDAVNMHHH